MIKLLLFGIVMTRNQKQTLIHANPEMEKHKKQESFYQQLKAIIPCRGVVKLEIWA